MAVFQGNVYSRELNMVTQVYLCLPQDNVCRSTDSQPMRTLVLLHGLTDNASAWVYRTSILRYAEEQNMAVLIPEAGKSFFQDMKYGEKYESYIAEELPELAAKMFRIPTDRRNMGICGVSMGGYGALWIALRHASKFSTCGVFSPVSDVNQFVHENVMGDWVQGTINKDAVAIWGTEGILPDSVNLHEKIASFSEQKNKLSVYLTCGKQDPLYKSCQELRASLAKCKKIELFYEERNGTHGWEFWDEAIQKYIGSLK
jgi:putative tributyrin esterase